MMPKELFYSRTFWDRYHWGLQDDFSYEMLEDNPIHFQLTDDHALLLDPGDDFAYISLSFQDEAEEEIEIAWDDEAQFHPNVLRWSEYKTIVGRIAEEHELESWIPALLLRRFVSLQSMDELQDISAWELEMRRASGLYTESELREWFEESMAKAEEEWESIDRTWVCREPFGWIVEGDDAYSLRQSDNTAFPFQQWNLMLAELGCER
ncbi:hypothetical protein D3P09_00275 [Paenibacillus pinisoli]|uniref:Uncharacterized protein n=1 Tax=Paenibacillus pinisoli TaxID=1276110 RepID=A0A3A6PH78_9BACL|nr:hypothetical protein [Paenibacillus pinisoli]RJX40497.1 hypothetical protein D3P09_00275 [Paenibacillus pinisoli]